MKQYEVKFLTDAGDVVMRVMHAHHNETACLNCRAIFGGHYHTAQEVQAK